MHQRFKRVFWLSALITFLATATLIACWLLPGLIPAHWRNPARIASQVSAETYLVPGAQHVNYLQIDLTFAAQGEGLHSSTLITAILTDRAYPNNPSGGAVRGDRAAALERLRKEFPSLCALAGCEGAGSSFDAIVAAGKNGLLVEYPERRRAATLMSLRPYVLYTAAAALLIAAPLTLYFITVAARARWTRRPNCCGRCGYSLAGLTHTTLCPECGSDIQADLGRQVAHAGRTRRVAGWAILLLGLGITAAWFTSTSSDPNGFQLISHQSDDGLNAQELRLIRGGLKFQAVTVPAIGLFGPGTSSLFLNQALQPTIDAFNSPDDVTNSPATVPSDWSLWRYKATTTWLSLTSLWIALWLPALLLLASGGILLAWGYRTKAKSRPAISASDPVQGGTLTQ